MLTKFHFNRIRNVKAFHTTNLCDIECGQTNFQSTNIVTPPIKPLLNPSQVLFEGVKKNTDFNTKTKHYSHHRKSI